MYQTFKLFSVGFKTSCITFFCFAPTVSIPHIWDTLTFSDGFQTPCIAFFYFTLTVSKPHVSDFLYCSDGFRTSGLGYFNFSPVVSKLLVSDSPTCSDGILTHCIGYFNFLRWGCSESFQTHVPDFTPTVSKPSAILVSRSLNNQGIWIYTWEQKLWNCIIYYQLGKNSHCSLASAWFKFYISLH